MNSTITLPIQIQDPSRLHQLMQQFPSIEPRLKQGGFYENDLFAEPPLMRFVSVLVQRADANLTYQPSISVGWRNCPENPSVRFHERDYFEACDQDGELVSGVALGNGAFRVFSGETVHDLLADVEKGGQLDRVFLLQRLQIRRWQHSNEQRHVRPLCTEALVTVYQKPSNISGFHSIINGSRSLWKNVCLNSDEMDNYKSDKEFPAIQIELTRLFTIVQERVWNAGGLHDIVLPNRIHAITSRKVGWRGMVDGLEISILRTANVSSESSAGAHPFVRIRVKKEGVGCFTLELDRKSTDTLRVRDMNITMPDLQNMVTRICSNWAKSTFLQHLCDPQQPAIDPNLTSVSDL